VNEEISHDKDTDPERTSEHPIGWNITRKEKIKFLTKTVSFSSLEPSSM